LWEKVNNPVFIGPLLYERVKDSVQVVLSVGVICHILEMTQRAANERLAQLKQKLIEQRRAAYQDSDWSKYAYIVRELSTVELVAKEECLSMVLHKLEIAYSVYKGSVDYFMENASTSTKQEYTLISKSAMLVQQEMQVAVLAEFNKVSIPKQKLLEIFENTNAAVL